MVKTFNLTIPRKDDLRCMVCNIVNRRNDPMIKYPEYWRNKLKYRRFLDVIPEVMAAPKDFRDGVIYVIVAKDVFERSFATFRDDCMALDIQIVEQLHPISDSIYEMCLHNTVEHKLLLHWNAVGQFLVEGSDFLNSMRSVNAIKLNINIRDNNTQLHIKAFNLQIPFLELEGRDFQLPYLVNVLPSLAEVKAITRREAIQEHSGNLFVNYEDLREFWRKMVDQLYPISDSIYKKCLLNTVDHKLLLQWNKVGQFFVERSDFLNSMGSVDAIKLNINYIRDNNAQFHMKAFNLQIPFLKLEARDFQLLYPVNVLPRCARFVRANAIRRWEAIQEEHPFANYEDLREYWRRVHGYTLPVNEEGLLFYDVQFREFTMVYPEICLTSKQNLITSLLKNDAATRIYENFFEDLRRRVTTLCGQELVYPEVYEV